MSGAHLDQVHVSVNGGDSTAVHKKPSTSTIGTGDDEDMNFDCPEDEVVYYRERYRRLLDMLDETRAELDDFQASSKELEDELERELSATEEKQAELKDRIRRLEIEKEDIKAKLVALQKLHSSTTTNMQREMDNLRSERDKTLVALRNLEMGNDELERNERVAVSSLLDLESKYNRAIEDKTLLEQEVLQKQDLEEECQRLKDDLRDSTNEIAILREQLARAIPTPPTSISVPMSPVQEASQQISLREIPPLRSPNSVLPTPPVKTPEACDRILHGIPHSNTASSIPTLSPALNKRFSAHLLHSPSALTGLSRSTTSRNLAAVAAPASPSLVRSRSSQIAASPARPVAISSNHAAKTKGFRLLHDLQARLKATDDKLGTRVTKRNVSAPDPPAASRRTVPTVTLATVPARAAHARVTALTNESTPVNRFSDRSGVTMLSPNGWVLVSDGEETPKNQGIGMCSQEPASPLDPNFRPASSTGSRGLPARPGIPSPLAGHSSQLCRSTNPQTGARPPSRTSALASSTMTPLKSYDGIDTRPMSPSLLPQPSRSLMRSASPGFGSTSTFTPSSSNRPTSRQGTRDKPALRSQQHTLGRGPPPSSPAYPPPHSLGMSVSISTPTAALRRSTRRSSLGVAEATLPPSGIPAPRGTPTRPISVPVFGNSTPPPVPRIPSAHLRESVKRNGTLGAPGGRDRDRLRTGAR